MSKHDGVWVVMKGLGIYLLICALWQLPSVVLALWSLAADNGWGRPWRWGELFVQLGGLILSTAVGLYLLKGGKALLRWIGTSEDKVAEPTATEPEQQ
jgi:hypothetical protein